MFWFGGFGAVVGGLCYFLLFALCLFGCCLLWFGWFAFCVCLLLVFVFCWTVACWCVCIVGMMLLIWLVWSLVALFGCYFVLFFVCGVWFCIGTLFSVCLLFVV